MAKNATPIVGGGDGIQIQEPILSAIAEYAVVVPHPHHQDDANNKNTKNALKISPGVIGPHLPSWTLEDIESELTALVSIVPGCIYSFEQPTTASDEHREQQSERTRRTPVLYLPTNYASHVRSRRIQTSLWTLQKSLFLAALSAMRVLAAAGILISIALLALFVVALIVAAIVAMSSQEQNGGHRAVRRTRGGGGAEQLMGLLRGALWYHYIFGDDEGMMMGGPMMFMNPFGYYGDSSYLYWMMIRNMLRRNPRRRNNCVNGDLSPPPPRRQPLSNLLSVLDSADNDDDDDGRGNTTTTTTRRSLLAVVDEFLFGPVDHKRLGGPASAQDVWRLRAAVVTSRQALHPAELLPYVDNPPPVPRGEREFSLEGTSDAKVDLSDALTIVVHFRGTPDQGSSSLKNLNNRGCCYYTFEELTGGIDRMAEGTMGCAETGMGDTNDHEDRPQRRRKCRSLSIAQGAGDHIDGNAGTTYDIDNNMSNSPATTLDASVAKTAACTSDDPPPLLSVLCGHSSPSAPSIPPEWRPGVLHDLLFRRSTTDDRLPPHLTVGPTVFTNLSPILLGVCAAVAFVNLLCVHWMELYGLALDGPLHVGEWPPTVARVVLAVAWLMRWYSFFFVAVPLVRLVFVVLYKNRRHRSREVRRRAWAEALRHG